jgi:hypothetical protein
MNGRKMRTRGGMPGMKSRIIQGGIVTIIAFSLLASCYGTKVVAEWKDEAYQRYPSRVFVVGLSKERGPRSLIEDEFARQLNARGNDAIASNTVLPRDEKLDKEAVLTKAQDLGADVILLVKFLKKEIGSTQTPLRRYAVPQGFDTSWDSYYYGGVSTDIGVRDISYDYDTISMETTLFLTATRKPIWSALSQTTYQQGPIKQIKPFTAAIVKKLAQEKLVR